MNEDVFEYYDNVKEQYNTPLKIKRFKESAEYADNKHYLENYKSQLLEDTFFSHRILSQDEIFDLDKQCFQIRLPDIFNDYYSKILLSTEDNHFEGLPGHLKFITPKMDEDTAYKIECNQCDIVIFIKFTGDVGGREQAICKPIMLYIADHNTGTIYLEYAPDNDLSNREPKTDDESSPNPDVSDTKIYTAVESPAEFPGGNAGLMDFLSKSIKYPAVAAENGVQGRVAVRFVITDDGSIRDILILKSVSPELDKEAIRVIKSMPKWKPATTNGHRVNSYYTMPVTFKLKNS